MDIDVRPATPEDIEAVVSMAIDEDRKEFELAGLPMLDTALAAQGWGRVWYAEADGVPAAIYSVARSEVLSDAGIPWIVSTPALRQPAAVRMIAMYGKAELRRICHLAGVRRLHGAKRSGAGVAIRFLRHLGFVFDEDEAFDMRGEIYYPFSKDVEGTS